MAPGPALTSRHGEDFLILSAFAGQSRGFYIDVGAFDGVYGSNTWALAQSGWSGICIEPAPEVFPQLTRNRPSALCVEAACGADDGIATLSIDPTMQFRSVHSMDRVKKGYENAIEFRGLDTQAFSSVAVDVVAINGLLRRTRGFREIDLLNIDAESAVPEVFSGLDLDWYTPRLIVVSSADESINRWATDRLENAGYDLCRTIQESWFFAAEPALAKRVRRTAINCFLPRNLHPFGLTHTRLPMRNDRILLNGHEYILEELATHMAGISASNDAVAVGDGS